MKRIGILGDIGSGKSYVAKNFRFPVFNADSEVGKLYKNDKKVFYKLKKVLPNLVFNFLYSFQNVGPLDNPYILIAFHYRISLKMVSYK